MRRNWIRHLRLPLIVGVIATSLAWGHSAEAQAVFGQIQGTVTDPTGAAIPNATITVTDVSKGTTVTLTSNGTGDFTVEHLIPDSYTIRVTAPGFKGYEVKALPVYADTTPKVSAVLAVGAASDQVIEVNASDVPQLKTDRADVATVYNSQELTELPIPDHNFTNLQLLLPGAVQLGWAHAASENPQGSKQIQIDGQAFGGVNYTLDGTDNQDAILGIIVINPNSESMSEAKIATQNFDAEFGKAVASVQTVQTKSGSNTIHGTLFDNRESNANLARDPFTVSKAAGYPSGLKNQFGGSIGGPLWKDKVFFFGDYQGVRQKVGSSGIGTVPSLLALQSCTGATNASNGQPGCDFSQYIAQGHQIYNNNTATNGNSSVPVAYPNNIIPLSQISPAAVNLFKLLLNGKYTPNVLTTSGGLRNNFSGTGTGSFNSNQWDVRGDAVVSGKIHVFGRFSRFTDTLAGGSLFGPAGGPGLGIAGFGGTSLGANDSFAGGVDISVNSKLTTDVRLGYFRYNISTKKNDPGNTNLPILGENVSGTTSALTVPVDYGTPNLQIADVDRGNATDGPNNAQNTGAQFGTGLNMNHCNCPLKEKEDQFQVVNNWTKTFGNHAVKFGVDLRYARNLRVPSDADRTGVNNFGNGPTSNGTSGGLGFATFILGDVTSFNRYTSASASEANAKEFQPRDFFYVQDTWRASNKLTLNLGVRYEYYAPERVNGAGNGALLNLQTGFINVAGQGGLPLNMGVSAAKNAWNPRLGAAYQINDKTVVRMGYGRSFDLGVFGSTFGHVVTQNIPVLANQSLNGTGGTTSYAFNLTNPGAAGAAAGYSNATSPLLQFQSPAVNANGGIPINATIPGSNPLTTIGQSVNVKARPFTERLPTLDAWNVSVQRSLTRTLSLEVAYVGNKGTHTLSDGDGNNTNPNEPAISLPGSYSSINGLALHYDNITADQAAISTFCTATPANCKSGVPLSGTYQGATNNSTLLRRFVGGVLPACGGACNWNQDISYYGDDQDSHYNALQMKLTKTMTKGLSVSANYAYQRGTDNASGFATWNKQAVIGNDGSIRRNSFTAYGMYELPFGKGKTFLGDANPLANAIIGGWEFSPTFVYQSGLPFSLGDSGCGSYIPGSAPCRPNGNVSSISYGVKGTPGVGSGVTFFAPVISQADIIAGNNLCNAASISGGFTCSGLDQIGNINRNTAWGPHFFNADMSIMKNVTFHERYTAQFRMDAYNAFNHINLGNPNGNIDQSGTGSIGGGPYPAGVGGTTNPRQLQFTIHLQF